MNIGFYSMMNYWIEKALISKRQWKNMKIGFFDSWVGWLFTLDHCRKLLPQYDYVFYWDKKHMPYGEKRAADICNFTFTWINWLFENNCNIVILACNTASSYSIRKWQTIYPDKKVLSVTIPLIEEVCNVNWNNTLFLSTQATKASGIIDDLLLKNLYQNKYEVQSCNGLADEIELLYAHFPKPSVLQQKNTIQKYLPHKIKEFDSIALACTHYGICSDWIKELSYYNTQIIDTSLIIPLKLKDYLSRHPEIENNLSKNWSLEIYWNM